VESSGAMKKQHGDLDLAIGCRWEPEKRTQGKGGSQKKLAAACRG
jgi:hypothetical protein